MDEGNDTSGPASRVRYPVLLVVSSALDTAARLSPSLRTLSALLPSTSILMKSFHTLAYRQTQHVESNLAALSSVSQCAFMLSLRPYHLLQNQLL